MISIANGRLHLEDINIVDKEIVHFFSAIQTEDEREIDTLYIETLIRALKIGVYAIQRSQTQVDIDAIRHEFEQLHQQMDETLEAIFNQDRGKLALALDEYMGEDGKLAGLLSG